MCSSMISSSLAAEQTVVVVTADIGVTTTSMVTSVGEVADADMALARLPLLATTQPPPLGLKGEADDDDDASLLYALRFML